MNMEDDIDEDSIDRRVQVKLYRPCGGLFGLQWGVVGPQKDLVEQFAELVEEVA